MGKLIHGWGIPNEIHEMIAENCIWFLLVQKHKNEWQHYSLAVCEGGNAKTWKTLSSLARIITHHNINETGEILFPPSSEHLFIKSLVRQVFVVCAVLSVKFFYSGVSVITSFASWCWRDILSFVYVLEIGMAEGAGSNMPVIISEIYLVYSN